MRLSLRRSLLRLAILPCLVALGSVSMGRQVAHAAPASTSGLIAHFPFNNSLTDQSVIAPAGTADVNGTTAYTAGPTGFGNAFSFDGNTYLELTGYDTKLPFADENRSIAAWINVASHPARILYYGSQVGTAARVAFYTDGSGRLSFNGVGCDATSSTTISLNTWTHVAMTYQSGSGAVVFYKDGSSSSAALGCGALDTNSTTPFRIGASDEGPPPAGKITGAIDDVRVYDRVLSGSEVTDLMSATSIPTLSEWGMLTMFVGLAGAMLYTMRKKRIASGS